PNPSHRGEHLGRVDGANHAIKDEKAESQQGAGLDGPPAVQRRLPASRSTVAMARKISCREIFDCPRVRSVKVIGISTIRSPARSQRVSNSISAEYPEERSGRLTSNCMARRL